MYDLTKVNIGFEEVKRVRLQIEGDFSVIQNKLNALGDIYANIVSKHKKIECTLGVDALFFQSELIQKEFSNMKNLFNFINNRIYCEYYKLYYYVKDYITNNMGENVVHELNFRDDFPSYKSLDTDMIYDFAHVLNIQSLIVVTLDKMQTFFTESVSLNNKEKMLLKMGLHIDTVIHTQDYTNSVMCAKLKMFYNYLLTFNEHHTKHLSRLFTKTRMIVDIISDDMPMDTEAKTHTDKVPNEEEEVPNEEEEVPNAEEEVPNAEEKKELDNSSDITKFAKSIVEADNISFSKL